MDFASRFKQFVAQHSLFHPSDKLLLAVSGGVDSMVLLHLLTSLGYRIGVAHCNFQLRGEESSADALFVKSTAEKWNVPFFVKQFETKEEAERRGESIQMAARTLRYSWFEEIRAENGFDFILTAHHQNDVVETVIFNLVKGTGLTGLHGILPKREKIVRPLLFARKEELEHIAIEHHLVWREDSSNASDKYARNLLRNQIIPLLKQINPNIEEAVFQTSQHVRASERLLYHLLEERKEKVTAVKEAYLTIDVKRVQEELDHRLLLFHILGEYGFGHATISDISDSTQIGAVFYSPTHRLLRDRDVWVLDQLDPISMEPVFLNADTRTHSWRNGREVTIEKSRNWSFEKGRVVLDFERLEFPLLVRRWEKGDRFVPFGMKGSKLVSDFLIDEKLNLFEKEKVLVLVSQGSIAAVLGLRPSQDFCVTEKTAIAYQIGLS
jgi:tRNA(Ile)-lysidine synthase